MDPDRILVRLAKHGNRAAFGKLAQKYRDQVLALTFDFLKDYESAKDIAQDVFIKAFKNMRDFEEKAQFSSWLYRITVNACLDAQKRVKNRPETRIESSEHETAEQRVKENNQLDSIDDTMAYALEQLSNNQRTAVILRYFHDKTIQEIAEVIDCAESTVRIHLHRAMQKMSNIFKVEG